MFEHENYENLSGENLKIILKSAIMELTESQVEYVLRRLRESAQKGA